jgi:HPt (histidine-containing phosphotransfer) domain-containing protein
LDYIVEIDKDIDDLIPNFLNNRKKDLDEFEALLKDKNFNQICLEAHNFKGTSGSYGFFNAQELGIALEKASIEKDVTKAKSLIDELKEYFSNLQIIYVEDEE